METQLILDAAALLWPIVVLILLLAYRKTLPKLFHQVAGRVSKVEVAGIALELAKAEAFQPAWSGGPDNLDFRKQAAAVNITDSYTQTFLNQLRSPETGDYAVVNLGAGGEWLSTRLFIMAILYPRMKGIRAFVFLENLPTAREKYVGWASTEALRYALASRFPWLEKKYALTYWERIDAPAPFPVAIIDHQGKVGREGGEEEPLAALELVQRFVEQVQTNVVPAPPDEGQYVKVHPPEGVAQPDTYEHAEWLTGSSIESILGDSLHTSSLTDQTLISADHRQILARMVKEESDFLAVTRADMRFAYLLDRRQTLENMATDCLGWNKPPDAGGLGSSES